MKTKQIISAYSQSTGSIVQLFDRNFQPVETDGEPSIEKSVCCYCSDYVNCGLMHANAMRESGCSGKYSIYQCELGLMFWTCPIYSNGNFSGALRGTGYLNDNISGITSKCSALSNDTIPFNEFVLRVLDFPSGNVDKIHSLAEILLLFAESLSSGSDNNHEKLRMRHEQQASLSAIIEEMKVKYPPESKLPGYPFEKEKQLLSHLRQGNKNEADKLLDEILALLIISNPEIPADARRIYSLQDRNAPPAHFRNIQLRALELAVLIIRAENSGCTITTDNYIRSIKQIIIAKTTEELAAALHSIVDIISRQIISFQGIPHASAMRKAEMYIRENLVKKISLSEIAGFVGLSAPYFSTIFKEEMGENLSRYINRLRVEKAVKMLLETTLSLSEIAGECCFEDQSWFSKIFKSFTGISPGKYRTKYGNNTSA